MANIADTILNGAGYKENTTSSGDGQLQRFFTSTDMMDLTSYLNDGVSNHSIMGIVQFFDAKLGTNRLVKLLQDVLDRGVKVMPKILFHPVTEKCSLKNGVFHISNKPYVMGDSVFVNNLIVVKLLDGTYVFHDGVTFTFNDLKCVLSDDKISGHATVSYFVLDVDKIGGGGSILSD